MVPFSTQTLPWRQQVDAPCIPTHPDRYSHWSGPTILRCTSHKKLGGSFIRHVVRHRQQRRFGRHQVLLPGAWSKGAAHKHCLAVDTHSGWAFGSTLRADLLPGALGKARLWQARCRLHARTLARQGIPNPEDFGRLLSKYQSLLSTCRKAGASSAHPP